MNNDEHFHKLQYKYIDLFLILFKNLGSNFKRKNNYRSYDKL